jgi:PAS domain S-box-containing protein
VSRKITAPIHKLHEGTEIIGKGNLDYKVGTGSKDEIGQLSRAFDKMTEDLKKTTTSIVDLNREINERKLAEEALRESEERYKQLVDYANDLIYRTDANGNFTFCNPVTLRLMEYSEDELIGKNYLDLIRPDYRQDAEKFYGVQFVGNIPNTYYEFPVITQNGKEIWLGQNVQLIMEGEKKLGFQAVARDITDRKMAEEALRKATALETLTTVLENFISDSLGNLLTPIYTHIELCKIQDSVDQIKSSLEEITKGLTRLLTGINAYRRFSKLGEASLGSISSVDIRSILGPLLSGQPLKTYGEEEFPMDPNVKLRFVFDPKEKGALTWEELPLVLGIEIAIATALQETLINAVESHDPQKRGEVMVSAKKKDHNLIIEIADKGRGMSNNERDKSQLPFFKILGMKKSGRLGLGAYIARETAKYCGGDIQIESTEGVGTTVSIILKVNDEVPN